MVHNSTYRLLHERYMQDHNGTTIWENFTVITPSTFFVFFVCFVKCFVWTKLRYTTMETLISFMVEFIAVVMPIILLCTIMNAYTLNVLILSISGYAFLMVLVTKSKNKLLHNVLNTPYQQDKKPHITYLRSIINIFSTICILAVDFKIFPRRFAKTETFGYGLMDTGVGFFVMGNGIVINPKTMNKNTLIKSIYSSLPLIVIGLLRTLSVEKLNYQKHVSEYGLHWNFFFTLAAVKLTTSLLFTTWSRKSGYLALSVALLHQLALSSGFQDWVLSDIPRDDFFTSNREGLMSLPGYLSLYLTSVSMGAALRSKAETLNDALYHSFRLAVCFITFLCLTLISEDLFGISRRLANLTYILWITTLCLLVIGISLMLEVSLRVLCIINKVPHKMILTPLILDAINYNGLLFFLFSNLLTGFVNLSVETLHVSPINSFCIITAYMFTLISVILLLYIHKIKLKFW